MRPLGLGLLAAAAAITVSASDVKGKVFDRFVTIWLENTDYDKAAGDREWGLNLWSLHFILANTHFPQQTSRISHQRVIFTLIPHALSGSLTLFVAGILLSNYFALTHPSEPNYVASVGGEYFGINNDDLNKLPANISSVADLLEDKGISWGEYQEDMPYTGFTGFDYPNQETKANDYVRKHK